AAAIRIVVERPPGPTRRSLVRRHVSAVYRIEVCDRASGKRFQHHVFAKGVGLGYLGTQSLDIARRLGNFVPEVYGISDGIMFRTWLPDEDRLQLAIDFGRASAASQIARYVSTRQAALPVHHAGKGFRARVELSQRCIDLLSPSFGRAAPVVRYLLPGPFRRLVRAPKSSVVDGNMEPSRWFVNRARAFPGEDPAPPLLKVDADDGAFWSGASYSYDAAFDLACAAVDYKKGSDD